ncbi:flagellar biosynthetic protein FliO [Paenarthrobacter sp. Z7-10]|uniref:FliO/MopB family protein n=1 Tax=Paenarthrobacter sp. Z7-10 TaxID=2787635 RepID=UPI0022A93ACF|nr:flagellar biosynthetic protein FliO [Paenarthrobacter sp. Z7-10]MCZ2403306.1 flagellar biosynthetic protein FliO [Paenarthrobacter sp. Z7-10]
MDTVILALRVVLSLGAVVTVLWLVQRRMVRGTRTHGAADPLKVVARRGLGQKASVVLIDTGGQRFVLGVTEHAVNVLHSSEAPVDKVGEQAFALSLAKAQEGTTTKASPAFASRQALKHSAAKPSALSGSILSASTWKQASAAIRKGLNG